MIAFAKLQPIMELGRFTKPLSVLVSFGLALVSWRLVEQPFRGDRLIRMPLRTAAFAIITMAAVTAGMLAIPAFAPTLTPTYVNGLRTAGPDVVRYADRINPSEAPCQGTLDGNPAIHTCHIGVPGRPDDLVIWGDSYAGALVEGMDRAARQRGLSGTAYFVAGCPPIVDLSNVRFKRCDGQVHRTILDRISQTPNRAVVFLYGNIALSDDQNGSLKVGGEGLTVALMRDRLRYARSRLNDSGKILVLVEQGPQFPREVARFYLRDRLRGGDGEMVVSRDQRVRQEAILAAFRQSTDQYLSTTAFFCGLGDCRARDDNSRLVVRDRDHITELYSERLANYVLDRSLAERFPADASAFPP